MDVSLGNLCRGLVKIHPGFGSLVKPGEKNRLFSQFSPKPNQVTAIPTHRIGFKVIGLDGGPFGQVKHRQAVQYQVGHPLGKLVSKGQRNLSAGVNTGHNGLINANPIEQLGQVTGEIHNGGLHHREQLRHAEARGIRGNYKVVLGQLFHQSNHGGGGLGRLMQQHHRRAAAGVTQMISPAVDANGLTTYAAHGAGLSSTSSRYSPAAPLSTTLRRPL